MFSYKPSKISSVMILTLCALMFFHDFLLSSADSFQNIQKNQEHYQSGKLFTKNISRQLKSPLEGNGGPTLNTALVAGIRASVAKKP